MKSLLRLSVLWAVLSTIAMSVGCAEGKLQEVSGTVTFKKQPVESGLIEYWPIEGQGSKQSAIIQDGAYKIAKETGLQLGKYKVLIMAGDGRTSDAAVPDEPPGPRDVPYPSRKVTPGKERIPPEYNEKSTLVREVTKGPNRFDFDIP